MMDGCMKFTFGFQFNEDNYLITWARNVKFCLQLEHKHNYKSIWNIYKLTTTNMITLQNFENKLHIQHRQD
jgi:hypothetical protein